MWKRNLLFVVVCLVGAGSLVGSLMRRERILQPTGFEPGSPVPEWPAPEWREVVQQINQEFAADWTKHNVVSVEQAPQLTIIRRLSLGLTGTVPSLEEIRALEQVPEANRISWWLARILHDRRYADYVAERLARAYVGAEDGPFIFFRRRRFTTWLSDQLITSRPYDQMVSGLISDSGLWTDTPAVNFVTVTVDQNNDNAPDPIRLAGRTSRAFLGMRIDCLQCHDDPLGKIKLGPPDSPRDGTQQDFHHLAAFFGQTGMKFYGIADDKTQQYKYKYLNAGSEELVPAKVPFLPELLTSGGTRRDQLARWVTHPRNKSFARATVNRIWALMFGRPLVYPIDDIPLYDPLPPGMETLATDFVDHGFDLQRLIQIIAATDVFQKDSRSDDSELSEAQVTHWAAFPLTRLRPEQVAGAVIQAASLNTIDARSNIISRITRFTQENDFVVRYGDMGEDEFEDRGGTVTQRLLMMNGELTKERTQDNPLISNAATRIARLAATDDLAVDVAYLTVLTRRPTPAEREHFSARLKHHPQGDERVNALEDLCWVLFNSSEFSWTQ